jgi:hypothetical protein
VANTGTADLHITATAVPSDALWLSLGTYPPFVPPGLGTWIPLALDTTGLSPEACYTATLQFTYDDPYVQAEAVPVTLCVVPACDGVTEVDFGWTPPTTTLGQAFTLTAAVVGTPTLPVEYTWGWGDGGGLVTTATVVTHAYTATGTYSVTLTAANACGQAEAVHLLTVQQPPVTQWRIYLPVVVRASARR